MTPSLYRYPVPVQRHRDLSGKYVEGKIPSKFGAHHHERQVDQQHNTHLSRRNTEPERRGRGKSPNMSDGEEEGKGPCKRRHDETKASFDRQLQLVCLLQKNSRRDEATEKDALVGIDIQVKVNRVALAE